MDITLTQLITAAPNLAVGLLCFWYAQQVIKERIAAQERYAASIEAINTLYMKLLERAVAAIENSIAQSETNGTAIAQLHAEFAAFRLEFRSEMGKLYDTIQRSARDSAKRNSADRGTPRPG